MHSTGERRWRQCVGYRVVDGEFEFEQQQVSAWRRCRNDLSFSVTLDSNDNNNDESDGDGGNNIIDINSQQMSSVHLIRFANDVTYETTSRFASKPSSTRRTTRCEGGIRSCRTTILGERREPSTTLNVTSTSSSSSPAKEFSVFEPEPFFLPPFLNHREVGLSGREVFLGRIYVKTP